MHLTTSDALAPVTRAILPRLADEIAALLPGVELHHVGATAIPGALTKGDLDVVLRVERAQFQTAIAALQTKFDLRQQENWDNAFASFGTDSAFPLPVGVQLVIKDSEADFFLFTRDYLIAHPGALARYNEAKREHADCGADVYWAAKDRVLRDILAEFSKRSGQQT